METEKVPTLPKHEASESSEAMPFESVVESSKEKLAQETAEQVKRGRGRPPGTGKNQKASAEENPKPGPGAQEQKENPSAAIRTLTHDLKPVLAESIKVPFSLASAHFEEPQIEATDKEAAAPAQYLSNYLREVFPDLEKASAKTFNLLGFAISFGILILRKLPLVAKKQKERVIKAKENPVENPLNNSAEENSQFQNTPDLFSGRGSDFFGGGR